MTWDDDKIEHLVGLWGHGRVEARFSFRIAVQPVPGFGLTIVRSFDSFHVYL